MRDEGTFLNKFELAQTIVNDSTYFGNYDENDDLNRYRIEMNGRKFELRPDNTYKISYNDYIHLELTRFRNRYTYIDSSTTHYTIQKTRNGWKDVVNYADVNNSDK